MEPRRYVDHAATTPARREVVEAMRPYFSEFGFNPSSAHTEGRAARAALDRARASVAAVLGARPLEIVFTAGGSEADNLAVLGVARAQRGAGRRIVTVATEHRAVLHAVELLRDEGYAVSVLPVDENGALDPADFEAALGAGTVLASVMLANNELGTLQPIPALARIAHEHQTIFHSDGVQAPGRVPLDVDDLGVDLLSLSAHKFYGPKGVGLLYVRSGTPLAPLIVGGEQEAGLRAGTENVAGAVGLAAALELAAREQPAESVRLRALRDRFEAGILATVEGVRVNAATGPRLPNVSSLAFAAVDGVTLAIRLDLAGVAVSTGSACAAGSIEPSHVIAAIGGPAWAARGTVRFSFGKLSTEQDVDALLGMLPTILASLREPAALVGTIGRSPSNAGPHGGTN